jgi:hypothetical protein
MEFEVAVLLILAAPRQEAVKVSTLRFLIWPGLTCTIPDPIILSDDESAGAESETDCGDLDVNVRAKSDSDPPHVADSELADGDGFASEAALISGRLVTDYQDDDNNHNNGVVDKTRLRLSADRPRSASPDPGSDTHQSSKLQVNTDITQGSTSYDNLDVTKELEGEDFDVFAKGDDGEDDNDDGTRSTKGRKLSAVSDNNPASDSNISGMQDGQPDDTQYPQLCPAAASLHQLDPKNDHLPKHRHRGATRDDLRKRPRTAAPIRPTSTARPASAAPESGAEAQSRAQITAPDQEMVDDASADDADDEDYADMSDAAGSKRGGRPRSRKRVRRTKDREHSDVEGPSPHSLDVLCQAAAATSSSSMQESEEIPIHGYLTLKTIESKVVYCLTFSQELLPEPSGTLQSQGLTRGVSSSSDRRDSERSLVQERSMSRPVRNSRFSPQDDELLLQLKGEGLSWDEISDRFPERSKGALQVHYSTKLKPRSETSKNTRKRRRSG